MREYHKIDSVYKRDERGKFLIGEFSRPEFEYLKDNPWQWTEKIDGTNIRVMYNGIDPQDEIRNITFGGKIDNAQIPVKLITHLENTFLDKHMLLAEIFGNTPACLYGEGYGAGIQKGGGNYSPDQRFILFDVRIGDWWLTRDNVEDIARKLNIPVVGRYGNNGVATLQEVIDGVRSIMKDTNPQLPVSALGNLTAYVEGWVGTPLVPLFARNGDRIITKIKYRDFK